MTLSAPITVAFDYTRSTGPVLGRFFAGLADGVIIGGRTAAGQVVVPPPEYDPDTHEAITYFVQVADVGTVVSWTSVPEPVAGQPLSQPFAFALIHLDGADTPLLHAVAVHAPDQIESGMRVRARWTTERVGAITDIACFEVADPAAAAWEVAAQRGDAASGATPPEAAANRPEALVDAQEEASTTRRGLITPVSLDYVYAASPEESAFYRGLAEGRIIGQRCPTCAKVYVPPRSACPADGTPTTEEVELAETGTVTTFCIVNVPFLGQRIIPPYVSAYVLLDGADIAFLHLILDIASHEVRMGMRVQAVWKPREQWGTTIENISHFAPTGEPDADYESYRQHL